MARISSWVVRAFPDLEEFEEILDGKTGLLEDMSQCRTLDWSVSGNRQLESFLREMLLEPNVTAPLPNHDPSVALQCSEDLLVAKAGNLGHTAISSTSLFGPWRWSSSMGSR